MRSFKDGFTIIEVVLVLAIAGLIFLMVFIALPALQRAQRDTQRKNNIAEIIAATESYRKNNHGHFPGVITSGSRTNQPCFNRTGSGCDTLKEWNSFIERYASEFVDPSNGYQYHVSASANYGAGCREQAGKSNNFRTMKYTPLVVCYSTNCDESYSNAKDYRTIAILFELEQGGVVCMSNK